MLAVHGRHWGPSSGTGPHVASVVVPRQPSPDRSVPASSWTVAVVFGTYVTVSRLASAPPVRCMPPPSYVTSAADAGGAAINSKPSATPTHVRIRRGYT